MSDTSINRDLTSFPKGKSWGGWKCKKCNHDNPEWTIYHTDLPRKGDSIEECVYCEARHQVYTNEETLKELREKREKTSKTIKRLCERCSTNQTMLLQEGPTKKWSIAECIQCGKRHDVFSN
jgi:hypothetical protein